MKFASEASMNSIASIIISALVIAGGISTVATARAAGAEQQQTKIVSYADLNVDSEKGAKILYARLQQAAQQVCGLFESRELSVKAKWQSCYDTALSSAVAQVNKIAVTKLYQVSAASKGKS